MRVQALGFRSYMVWKLRYKHFHVFSVFFHHFFQFSIFHGTTRWSSYRIIIPLEAPFIRIAVSENPMEIPHSRPTLLAKVRGGSGQTPPPWDYSGVSKGLGNSRVKLDLREQGMGSCESAVVG